MTLFWYYTLIIVASAGATILARAAGGNTWHGLAAGTVATFIVMFLFFPRS